MFLKFGEQLSETADTPLASTSTISETSNLASSGEKRKSPPGKVIKIKKTKTSTVWKNNKRYAAYFMC